MFQTLAGVFHPGKIVAPKAPMVQPKTPQDKVKEAELISEAQAHAKEILINAKDEALRIKSEAEQLSRNLQSEISKRQQELAKQEAEISKIQATNETKQQLLDKLERQLGQSRQDIDKLKEDYKKKIEEVSGLTKDQAQDLIFKTLEQRLAGDIDKTIKGAQAKAQAEAKAKVQEILVDALKHGANEYVAEYTVSTVKLANEDSKGRIIGKEGRNIRAFEKITGVDIDLDETPGEVRLSSFDPIRREIAKVTLSRLLADGRIQPTRIEEYVKKATNDLEKITFEEGKKLCHAVNVFNLPRDLIAKLGQYKYHFANGQNLLARTLEQVKIGVSLAEEVGANVETVRLACLLHDIGRVLYQEEGNHVDLGVKLLKRYHLSQAVIDAIASHHQEDQLQTPEAVIVYIADLISVTRPGAAYSNYRDFVKRLKRFEEIATSFEGVTQAYALQAGREVRLIVEPTKITDEGMGKLSLDLKERLREEMTYPGSIGITIVRETRAVQVAK